MKQCEANIWNGFLNRSTKIHIWALYNSIYHINIRKVCCSTDANWPFMRLIFLSKDEKSSHSTILRDKRPTNDSHGERHMSRVWWDRKKLKNNCHLFPPSADATQVRTREILHVYIFKLLHSSHFISDWTTALHFKAAAWVTFVRNNWMIV